MTGAFTALEVFLTVMLMFFTSSGLCAREARAAGSHTPLSILDEIRSKGAKTVVDALWQNEAAWLSIVDRIASGDEAWLKVAAALRPGSDAGATWMLTLAVSEALEHNPSGVLTITVPVFPLSEVCGAPDLDDDEHYDSSAVKSIGLRIAKVRSMKDGLLRGAAERCVVCLEGAKRNITRHPKVP